MGRGAPRGGARSRGGPAARASPSPRTARCCSPSAARRARCSSACTGCSSTRRCRWCGRWPAAFGARSRERGRRGAALHEREPAPRAQKVQRPLPPLADARARPRPAARLRPAERALLRRASSGCRSPGAAGAGARGAAGSPSAATTPCSASSASTRCSTAATCPLYFLESVVYHEMLHHHLGGVPDRAGRTVYHSRAFRAGGGALPLAPRGPGLGEGEPAPPPPGQPGARPRAPGREIAPARRTRGRARPALMPHLRRLLPYLRRHRRNVAWGLLCLLLTTAFSVASPWVLRHAVDDLTAAGHAREALPLRRR